MQVTWLDSNSWLLEIDELRILIDPWLVDSLVFGDLTWLFEGKRPTPRPIPDNIDLILLSQGLEDHAHPPTLKILDHNIPVVASPNGARVVQGLGYQQVITLEHGETFNFQDRLNIKAVPGSPIGPMLVENGYLLQGLKSQTTLYYEPHGYHSSMIEESAPVDVAIAPVIDQTILYGIPIIQGQGKALKMAKALQPQIILPTAEPGEVNYQGLLVSLLRSRGTLDKFQEQLKENQLTTQVLQPQPGVPLPLTLNTLVS